MKKFFLLVILLSLVSTISYAQRGGGRGGGGSHSSSSSSSRSNGGVVHVRGYYRKDGTYVAPHERSAPDDNFDNNWSTKGNVNPYTGKEGTRVTPPNSRSYGVPEPVDPSSNAPTEAEPPADSQPEPREGGSTPSQMTRTRITADAESAAENSSPTPSVEIAVVITERANLRDQPSQAGSVLLEVKEGNALVLTGQSRVGGWYSVVEVITGKEGWIHGNTIRIAYTR